MDDVLNGQSQEQPKVEGQEQQAPELEALEPGETTAPETDRHVPLAALEAERKGRQDWKEKAIRYEEELKALRNPPPQQNQQPHDPIAAAEARIMDMTLNVSERMARKSYGNEEVDKAFAKFQTAAAKNPFLQQQALSSPDPWDFVVQEGKKLAALEEIGSDPVAYREKLRAEILAEGGAAPVRPVIPGSLAGVRSAAGRAAPGFTGPPPLDTLFTP